MTATQRHLPVLYFHRIHPRPVHLHQHGRDDDELQNHKLHKGVKRKNVWTAGNIVFWSMKNMHGDVPSQSLLMWRQKIPTSLIGVNMHAGFHDDAGEPWQTCDILCVLHVLFLKVDVENNCTLVSPNQQVLVTVKTVPSYCGITWTGTYHTPGKSTCIFA